MKNLTLYISLLLGLQLSCISPEKRVVIKNKEGYTISVYKRGMVITDSVFNNEAKLTKVTTYFPGSKLVQKVLNFGNYQEDCLMTEFFANQKIKISKRCYGIDMPCEEKTYSENGALLLYSFYDSSEHKFYRREYLENKIRESGLPFFSSSINLTTDFYSEKDTVKALFIAPIPPDCETRLYTFERDKSYNNIYQTGSTPIFEVELYPLKKGNYEWLVYLEIKDKETGVAQKSVFRKIKYSVK